MQVLREEKEQINDLVNSYFQINAIFSCIQYCFPGVQSIHFLCSLHVSEVLTIITVVPHVDSSILQY